jgi:hypothetical protein
MPILMSKSLTEIYERNKELNEQTNECPFDIDDNEMDISIKLNNQPTTEKENTMTNSISSAYEDVTENTDEAREQQQEHAEAKLQSTEAFKTMFHPDDANVDNGEVKHLTALFIEIIETIQRIGEDGVIPDEMQTNNYGEETRTVRIAKKFGAITKYMKGDLTKDTMYAGQQLNRMQTSPHVTEEDIEDKLNVVNDLKLQGKVHDKLVVPAFEQAYHHVTGLSWHGGAPAKEEINILSAARLESARVLKSMKLQTRK